MKKNTLWEQSRMFWKISGNINCEFGEKIRVKSHNFLLFS